MAIKTSVLAIDDSTSPVRRTITEIDITPAAIQAAVDQVVNEVPATTDQDLGGFKIVGLADAVDPTDAVNLQTATGLIADLTWKPPVRTITTNPVTLSGEQTISGVVLVAGDRVGPVGQGGDETIAHVDNGPWIVQIGPWTRPTDFAVGMDVGQGAVINVLEGGAFAGTTVQLDTDGTVIVGTTALLFNLFPVSIPADLVTYDNATSGLAADQAQAALDEIDANLDDHLADTNNPHSTTAAQVGADPAGSASGAANVYRVGSLSEYATIQAAVDAAEADGPTAALPAEIWIPAKQWDEDVVIRKSHVHLVSPIGQGGTRIRSLTYTNATAASITAYEGNDLVDSLVALTQTDIPSDNQVRNIEVWNQESNAQASLRFLGAGAGTSFLGNELLLIDCTVRASGPSQDGLAIDGAMANYFSTGGYCWVYGEIRLRSVAGFWPLGAQLGAITIEYFGAAPYGQPSDTGNYGLSGKLSVITGPVVLNGFQARIGGDPAVGHRFESTITATGTGASDLKDCSLLGAVSLGAGTSMTLSGGVVVGAVSGAGTFTRTMDSGYLAKTGGAMSGAIDMTDNAIGDLADLTFADFKQAVNLQMWATLLAASGIRQTDFATTAPLPAYTVSGGGLIYTANANGPLSIDGNAPDNNTTLLVKDETDTTKNGIAVVTDKGSAGTPWILTLTPGAVAGPGAPFIVMFPLAVGNLVNVVGGNANRGSWWTCVDTAVMGTDPTVFERGVPGDAATVNAVPTVNVAPPSQFYLKSPDLTVWVVTISDAGVLTTAVA